MPAALPLVCYFASIVVVVLFSKTQENLLTISMILAYCHSKWLDKQENNEPNILEGTESEGTVMVDKMNLVGKPTKIVSHKEYEKQRLVKESKYFK